MKKSIASLADLIPDPRNARSHNARNVGLIETALQEVGAARSIVIDEDGVVLAGNATIEAAAAAGMEHVEVIDADGQTIIAVRRSGLTPQQKIKLALYDNRTAELAEWNPELLQKFKLELGTLGPLWSDEELRGTLGGMSGTNSDVHEPRSAEHTVTCPECGHEFTPAG